MARLKVLVILVNLVLLRLVAATELVPNEASINTTDSETSTRSTHNTNRPSSKLELLGSVIEEAQMALNQHQQQASAGSASVFDNINSLDYSPMAGQYDEKQPASSKQQNISSSSNDDNKSQRQAKQKQQAKQGASHRRRSRSKSPVQTGASQFNSIASFLFNLLGQLEKVDVKRVLADLSQLGSTPAPQARTASFPAKAPNTVAVSNNMSAAEQQQQQRDGKLNVSALSAEGGNLLSITRQLVKLARNQVLGDDQWGSAQQPYYASSSPGYYPTASLGSSSSWLSSAPASMLSAASHVLHDSLDFGGAHHHPASLKSDWLWWAAPAVIVVGAGVIVVPLIAAWLVSQAMNQNTFTVAAGRRRRRRRRSAPGEGPDPFQPVDLFKLLDLHQLLDDAPELLVAKLSKFYSALDRIGAQLVEPNSSTASQPKWSKP